ncbi:MAG: hypothetical protein ACI85O_000061 [Saprospiraceae bacterium]|jgi:hypothetical protein
MLFCFFCSDKRRGKKSKSERKTYAFKSLKVELVDYVN